MKEESTIITKRIKLGTFQKQKPNNHKHKIVDKVEHHRKFYSKTLNNRRDIIVWLPPSYKKEIHRRYPVLYMQDGQNVMDPRTAHIGIDWQVDETASRLIKSGNLQEIIIVGIYNTPERLEEYSDSPKGKNYMKFIVDQLKPFIDKYCGKAACMSSSFYYDGDKAINMVKNYTGEKKKIKIYIDHGEDGLPRGQRMFCELSQKGYLIGTDIDYYYAPGADHTESEWAKRIERPLLFFFGTRIDYK